jgi:hypothetical protein
MLEVRSLHTIYSFDIPYLFCRNLSFGLMTKSKGLRGCGLKGSSEVKAKRSQGCGPRRSLGITSHTLGNVRKYEGVNLHIPKATLTLGDEVSMDS